MSAEWSASRVEELSINFDGRRRPVKGSERRAGPYPYYGASGVVDYVDDYLFDGEYLLVAEDGENLRTRQTPIAFMAKGKFWVNNHAHIITGNERADTRFLMYALRYVDIDAYLTGAVMPKLTQGNLNRIEVLHPNLGEQRAIASVLGTLDDKIEQNRRTAQALEKLARAIFRAWFVDFEPVKAKAAGAISFPSMPQPVFDALPTRLVDSAIGPVPEGWEVKSLRDVCDVNAKSLRAGEVEGEIEYVNISSVTRGHLDQIERLDFADAPSRARRVIQDGDTIWSCVRPNRMSYLYIHNPPENRIVSTGFAVLTPTAVGPSFLYQLTTQPEFVDYLVANATGSAYPAVRADHFEAAQFGCAPKSALDAFESATSCMRRWIGEAENESRKLAQMRDYLLPKLLSGQIRVRAAERAAATVA